MQIRIAINRMVTGKLPQGDPRWQSFNDSFENVELEPVEIANAIYTGHAYTAWHNGRRSLENFICAQHIAVDMDSGDERSSFAVLQRHPFVCMYGGMMHTTPSHSDESPRARIIFFLDGLIEDTSKFQTAAKFLVAQFDGADLACTDAARFFYGATNCDIWISDNVLPLAHLRRYYRRWERSQVKNKPQPTRQQPAPSFAPSTYSTAYPSTRGKSNDDLPSVAEALRRIDPWSMDFSRWIGILAALHDTFGDAALPLAREWGAGQPGEVDRRWKTFGNYSGNKATLASIFDLAKMH